MEVHIKYMKIMTRATVCKLKVKEQWDATTEKRYNMTSNTTYTLITD